MLKGNMLDQDIDHRRKRILELLERHDLNLTYFEVFCKYIFAVEDAEGKMLWQTKGTDLRYLQKEIYQYLEDYDDKHPI